LSDNFYQRSCSTSGRVCIWLSDSLRAGKPFRYVTSRSSQLCLITLGGR